MPARTATPRLGHGPAMDMSLDDEATEEMVSFLKEKLSPEDFNSLKEMLSKNQETADEEAEDEEDDAKSAKDKPAKDSPPAFKGMPKTGGNQVAADAQGTSFADRWPNAIRIGLL